MSREGDALLAELTRHATDPLMSSDAARAFTDAAVIVRQALPTVLTDHSICDADWLTTVTEFLERDEVRAAIATELRAVAVDDLIDVETEADVIVARLRGIANGSGEQGGTG